MCAYESVCFGNFDETLYKYKDHGSNEHLEILQAFKKWFKHKKLLKLGIK